MFLVSDEKMLIAASKVGISGCVPALNYRTTTELEKAILTLKSQAKPFGINLIVNKSNFRYEEQLELCCNLGVDYIITSLGNPKETIEKAHAAGIKVFCDVTDLEYAKKVEQLGCDAVIAVNNQAGGHAGNISPEELIKTLKQHIGIPIISAGGVGNYDTLKQKLDWGADGVSVGSIFIASIEAPVSQDYKQAIVDYKAHDIVMTTKLSGTPCTVIKTPYIEQIGTEQNGIERFLNRNKKIKKWMKAFTFIKGMKRLQNAAFGATYKTVWCAGPTIEFVSEIKPISEIVSQLTTPENDQ